MMEEQKRGIFEEIEGIGNDTLDPEGDELFELDEAEEEEELNGEFDLDLDDEGDPDEEFDDSLDLDLDSDWEDEESEWEEESQPSQSQSLKDFAGCLLYTYPQAPVNPVPQEVPQKPDQEQ